jgi:flagellar basal-body rod modification protein FlgD
MAITPTINPTSVGPNPAAPSAPANPKGDMGRETFMKLLVAELKQQDPMDPMQGREMVAQLAQLSTVEKLGGIDQKLGDMQSSDTAAQVLQSAGLIGRSVSADVRHLELTKLANPSGNYTLANKAADVTIKVRNADGDLVRTIQAGAQKIGAQKFSWDGKTDKGMRAADGDYTFEVSATDATGNVVPASTRMSGLVTEVTYERGAPQVVVGGARIPLGDVTSIAQ